MTRQWLTLALLAIALLVTALLLLRAQPYDDSPFRAVFSAQPDCPEPCFMGIRPGVTTVDEAITILQTHEWTEGVFITNYGQLKPREIEWRWSSRAPSIVQHTGYRRGTVGADAEGVIAYIEFRTLIEVGEALLHWGKPEKYTTLAQTGGPIGGPRPPKPITYVYPDRAVVGLTRCPYSRQFWNADTVIVLGQPQIWLDSVIAYPFVSNATPITRFVHELTLANCPQ